MIFEQLNPGACRTYLIADEQSKQAILGILEQRPEKGYSNHSSDKFEIFLLVPQTDNRLLCSPGLLEIR